MERLLLLLLLTLAAAHLLQPQSSSNSSSKRRSRGRMAGSLGRHLKQVLLLPLLLLLA
jgi:hypothetical protein